MTTVPRTLAAIAAAVILGATVGLTVGGRTVEPCGTVTEDHVAAPAWCGDPAELHARLDALHAERSAGRFTDPAAAADLARCAETNGAALTVDACRAYLAELAAVAAACPMPDQDAYERCAAGVTR
jgi:hypothetical protein